MIMMMIVIYENENEQIKAIERGRYLFAIS